MSLYLRSLAVVCVVTLCALLGTGCRRESVCRRGATIAFDAKMPSSVLNAVVGGGNKEKPPYVYLWSPPSDERRIDGLTYYGWTLCSSPIPSEKAMKLGMPPEHEREAVTGDPSRRLVEVHAHRFEDPERRIDIRLSCKIDFFLRWDFEEVAVRDVNTGRVFSQGVFIRGPILDLETGTISKEDGVTIEVTFPPGDYKLGATRKK